jgi:oligoribonuclease NrnB/cAMP/cGMP phosphodiesterase (DHH superfamily)
METAILYHANCYDGFGSAWAAWKKFGDEAQYRPVQYGEEPPSLDVKRIYLLDFYYPVHVIEEMISRYERVVIIDHHKSAMSALSGLEGTIFDMEKSAAVLTWEHFFPETEVPLLLRYIQDYDLWKFELPNSKEVSVALSSHPMDFSEWDRLDPADLARDGRPLLRLQAAMVKMMCDEAELKNFDGHEVPVVNVSIHSSEVGAQLLKRYPDSPFSVSYHDRGDGQRHWSLRSRPDFDVSLIAKKFGGGGHKQAAGFETFLPEDNFFPSPPE